MIPAGCRQEGHPATETLHAPISPSFSTRDIAGKNEGVKFCGTGRRMVVARSNGRRVGVET